MEDRIYKLHVYAGVYEIKDVNEPVQTMYDKANMAIERIKGDYNQVISYYDESDMKRLMHEKSIVAEFDKALEMGNSVCICSLSSTAEVHFLVQKHL